MPDVSAVSHHTSQRTRNAAGGSLEATLNRRYRTLKDAEPQLWLSHYHKWGHLHGGLRDYHLGWLCLGKCQHESIWLEIVGPTLLGGAVLSDVSHQHGPCCPRQQNGTICEIPESLVVFKTRVLIYEQRHSGGLFIRVQELKTGTLTEMSV